MARDLVYTFAQPAEEHKQEKQKAFLFPQNTRINFFKAKFDMKNDGVCGLFYRLRENNVICHWHEDSEA
jgi:hypothetical protein